MSINRWLEISTAKLKKAVIDTARLDCLVLLEDTLQKDRSWLLAHTEHIMKDSTLYALNKKVERRARHEPLAYIRGKAEFYGREFFVDKSVLVPRSESENIIEALIEAHKELSETQIFKKDYCKIIDVGTGSGVLAITAKLEINSAEVTAIDIDQKCLKVAKANAQKLGANIHFYKSNLLQAIPVAAHKPRSIILANLPYVPDTYPINKAAAFEPRASIFAGTDGLAAYKEFFNQTSRLSHKPMLIITESMPFQHQYLSREAATCGYDLKSATDLVQVFRLRKS